MGTVVNGNRFTRVPSADEALTILVDNDSSGVLVQAMTGDEFASDLHLPARRVSTTPREIRDLTPRAKMRARCLL